MFLFGVISFITLSQLNPFNFEPLDIRGLEDEKNHYHFSRIIELTS